MSLYFALKNDPATKAIADDTEHQLIPKGLAPISPMGGLTLNAMVFKHTSYPNAAKAFLQFMLEKEQYEPWFNANSGYWSQPLAAYADAAVWSGDPKVKIFKDVMKSRYYTGYKGPISTATGAVNADYVLVQMCVGGDRCRHAGSVSRDLLISTRAKFASSETSRDLREAEDLVKKLN